MPRASERNKPRRLAKDDRIAEIMQVARAVLREHGSEQFSTAEVAERCGISEGTIYKYFASRRDLLTRVAEEWFEEFLEEEHPQDRTLPFRQRLLQVIRRNLSIIRAEPSLTRFLLADLRADPAYRTMRIYQQNRQFARATISIIEDGIAAGDLRSDVEPRTVRNMIQGCIEYQVWSYLRGEGTFSVEQLAQSITEIIVHGIARPEPAAQDFDIALTRLEKVANQLESALGAPAPSA
jgi:AcrR family transcriptional regulator